jgi:hypothetical protein
LCKNHDFFVFWGHTPMSTLLLICGVNFFCFILCLIVLENDWRREKFKIFFATLLILRHTGTT